MLSSPHLSTLGYQRCLRFLLLGLFPVISIRVIFRPLRLVRRFPHPWGQVKLKMDAGRPKSVPLPPCCAAPQGVAAPPPLPSPTPESPKLALALPLYCPVPGGGGGGTKVSGRRPTKAPDSPRDFFSPRVCAAPSPPCNAARVPLPSVSHNPNRPPPPFWPAPKPGLNRFLFPAKRAPRGSPHRFGEKWWHQLLFSRPPRATVKKLRAPPDLFDSPLPAACIPFFYPWANVQEWKRNAPAPSTLDLQKRCPWNRFSPKPSFPPFFISTLLFAR